MVVSKPPGRRTAGVFARLHRAAPYSAGIALFAMSLLGTSGAASAKGGAIRVLVYTSVSDAARASMSPDLWAKFVMTYAGSNAVAFAGPDAPTLADCRNAGAQFMLVAPFDLRPRLPGLANSSGRIAAVSHLVATNCVTSAVSLDQNVDVDSDPPSSASDGDFESTPEITWAHAVPATLARYPLAFQRVAHVFNVNSPYAYVDLHGGGSLRAGDSLRDFATSDGRVRPTPLILSITQVFDDYVEVTFGQEQGGPGNGDLVEPVPKTTK